eukprot:3002051-Amphidinium_carterae.1
MSVNASVIDGVKSGNPARHSKAAVWRVAYLSKAPETKNPVKLALSVGCDQSQDSEFSLLKPLETPGNQKVR